MLVSAHAPQAPQRAASASAATVNCARKLMAIKDGCAKAGRYPNTDFIPHPRQTFGVDGKSHCNLVQAVEVAHPAAPIRGHGHGDEAHAAA